MRVKVGHRQLKVEFYGNADVEDDGHWGDYARRTGIIRISAHGRPEDAQAETLIHEVLHALIESSGVEWDGDQEEDTCRTLAPRLAAFIRDNREVVDRLQAMLA